MPLFAAVRAKSVTTKAIFPKNLLIFLSYSANLLILFDNPAVGFYYPFAVGRKHADKNFNRVCNCMKVRDLAYQTFGRKYCQKVEIMFGFQIFFVSLQPVN